MSTPLQGFRFSVLLVENLGIPQLLDMRFSKVSGLSVSADVKSIPSGGQNRFEQRVPNGIKYGNLVLSRGMPVMSPLRFTVELALNGYQFLGCTAFVMLLDESGLPMATWLFEKAFPVKWSFSDLDASQGSPVIETLELAYERFSKLL